VTTAPPEDGRPLRIRPAERADLLEVYRIESDSFPQPWPFSAFEQFLNTPGFLVAEEGAVRGYIVADTVSGRGFPMGHIKDLAVHAEHRGRGVGSRLLERALARLDTEGVRAVKLEVRENNEPAISLYRSYGFEYRKTLAGYYDDGEDALLLVRKNR
jgi:ribosomal-protein-alanine N-acetyltransferase